MCVWRGQERVPQELFCHATDKTLVNELFAMQRVGSTVLELLLFKNEIKWLELTKSGLKSANKAILGI